MEDDKKKQFDAGLIFQEKLSDKETQERRYLDNYLLTTIPILLTSINGLMLLNPKANIFDHALSGILCINYYLFIAIYLLFISLIAIVIRKRYSIMSYRKAQYEAQCEDEDIVLSHKKYIKYHDLLTIIYEGCFMFSVAIMTIFTGVLLKISICFLIILFFITSTVCVTCYSRINHI